MSDALRRCEHSLVELEGAMVAAIRTAEAAPPAVVDQADAARVDGLRMRQAEAREMEVRRQQATAKAVQDAVTQLHLALEQLGDDDEAALLRRARALEVDNAAVGRAIVQEYSAAAVRHDVLLGRLANQL